VFQLEMILRLVVAGVCGALIGYERKSRLKEAGLRTHFVVAVGSALVMIVSKYGFNDIANGSTVIVDPSRIAAQVVSGIGFLGAGTIIVQRQSIRGLTTAAGLWSTAGIGLAIGGGMYWVGFGATCLVLIGLEVLDWRGRSLLRRPRKLIVGIMSNEQSVIQGLQIALAEAGIEMESFFMRNALSPSATADTTFEVIVDVPRLVKTEKILPAIQALPGVSYTLAK